MDELETHTVTAIVVDIPTNKVIEKKLVFDSFAEAQTKFDEIVKMFESSLLRQAKEHIKVRHFTYNVNIENSKNEEIKKYSKNVCEAVWGLRNNLVEK